MPIVKKARIFRKAKIPNIESAPSNWTCCRGAHFTVIQWGGGQMRTHPGSRKTHDSAPFCILESRQRFALSMWRTRHRGAGRRPTDPRRHPKGGKGRRGQRRRMDSGWVSRGGTGGLGRSRGGGRVGLSPPFWRNRAVKMERIWGLGIGGGVGG